jgi:hypothetical protein
MSRPAAGAGRQAALAAGLLVLGLSALPPARLAAADAAPAVTAAPALPALPAGTAEIHGSWAGQPYWARVLPADPHYGGQRLLQLSWPPPPPASIGGVRLVDCPFVLLDAQGRVVAWNGRDSLSQAMPGAPDGYQVSREIDEGSGEDAHAVEHKRIIHGPRGWDLQLAPLLLALTWHDGSAAAVPIVDLFGMRGDHQLAMRWRDRQAVIAGLGLVIEPDHDGACARILDSNTGAVLLSVDGRTQGSP